MTDLLRAIDRLLEAERNTRRRRDLRPLEAKAVQDLGATFRHQGRAFVRRFDRLRLHFADGSGSGALWLPLWDEARLETMRRFAVVTRDLHEGAMKAGARSVADSVGIRMREAAALQPEPVFDTMSARAQLWLSQHGAALVSGIDDTTRDRLAQIIADGIAQGQSYKQIAATIAATFDDISRTRALIIAVNEAAQAYSYGARTLASEIQNAGFPLVKTWITANDERVDGPCEMNAADGPIPLGDTFSSGSDWSPEHVNCRCDVAVEPADAVLSPA